MQYWFYFSILFFSFQNKVQIFLFFAFFYCSITWVGIGLHLTILNHLTLSIVWLSRDFIPLKTAVHKTQIIGLVLVFFLWFLWALSCSICVVFLDHCLSFFQLTALDDLSSVLRLCLCTLFVLRRYWCLRHIVFCFVYLHLVSCVVNIANFSGLFILYFPFGFPNVYILNCLLFQ